MNETDAPQTARARRVSYAPAMSRTLHVVSGFLAGVLMTSAVAWLLTRDEAGRFSCYTITLSGGDIVSMCFRDKEDCDEGRSKSFASGWNVDRCTATERVFCYDSPSGEVCSTSLGECDLRKGEKVGVTGCEERR